MIQMSVKQAAERWGVSSSLVYKWIAQGRVRTSRPGHEILITQAKPPERGARLSPEQRAAWPKGAAVQLRAAPQRSVVRYTGGPLSVKKIAP